MALATLSIDLEAKLAKLEEGMGRAARITEKNGQQMQRSLDSLKAASASVGALLLGAFAGFSTVAFVRSAVNGLDALNDLKDATSASIENISALEDVGARTGTSFESVSAALIKFNKVLSEAKPGSDTANILKSIGLDAEALKKVDPAEALRQTAVALSAFADDGTKARIVQELFGKSVKEVAPFLKDLATQGKLVATVTTEQAEAAEKFNQQLDSLKKNSTDSARSLVSELVPALNKFFEALNKNKQAGGFFDSIGKEIAANLLTDEIETKTNEIIRLQGYLEKNPGNPRLQLYMKALRQEVEGLQRQATAASDALKGFADKAKPTAEIEGGTNLFAGQRPAIKAPVSTADKNKAEAEAKRRTAENEKLARLLLDAEEQQQKDITEAQIAGQEIRLKTYKEDLAARETELKQFFDNIDAEQEREIAAGQAFADGIATVTDEASKKFKKFSEDAQANIEQTLGDNIFDALSGNFDNIEKAWGNMLKRMAAQALAQGLTKLILSAFGPSTGYGSGGGGGLAFAANGYAFDRSGVQAFARGDIFDSPTMFAYGGSNLGIMGEAGPEAIMPLKRGTDGKLGVASSGGGRGGGVYNDYKTINVGEGVSRGQVEAAVRSGQAETETRIRRMFRDGTL